MNSLYHNDHRTYLYFDHNASSLLAQQVKDLCFSTMITGGNPSSVHGMGRAMAALLQKCRDEILSEFQNAQDYDVVFTSGATEANNMVMCGFKGEVLISSTEHVSILATRPDATFAPVDENGIISLDFVKDWVNQCQEKGVPCLVAMMYANNESGVIQPVQAVSQLCRAAGAKFLCDAVQYFGKGKIDASLFDAISLSSQKIGGYAGSGCLVFKRGFPLSAMLKGGKQQQRLRPGTENICGALSMIGGLRGCQEAQNLGIWDTIRDLRDWFESEILTISPDTQIMSKNANRLPNTSLLTMPGVPSEQQIMMFDLEGVCLSGGSACSSGAIKESHVLRAMMIPTPIAREVVRVSMGPYTTHTEVEKLINIWKKIYQSTRNMLR